LINITEGILAIQFIGTSSGKTSLNRYHSSILIESAESNLLIDTGDGISRALMAQNIPFNSIENILISHYHADHFSGLSSLITQMKLNNRITPLTIYTYKELVSTLWSILNSHYLFLEKIDFKLSIEPFDYENEYRLSDTLSFKPIINSHVLPPDFYEHYKSISFNSSSFLITAVQHKVLYSSDIGSVSDLIPLVHLKPDILITETTHVTTEELNLLLKQFSPREMVLTHIDDGMEEELERWAKENHSGHGTAIIIAKDGLIIK